MKVIYVFEHRHGYVHDYDMFGMKYFEEADCQIEVWSMVYWTYGKDIRCPINEDKTGRTIYVDSKKDFLVELKRVKHLDEKIVFLCYPYNSYSRNSYFVRKHIKKAGFEYCNISVNRCAEEDAGDIDVRFLPALGLQTKRLLSGIKRAFIDSVNGKKGFWDKLILALETTYGPLRYPSKFNFLTTEFEYFYFPNVIESRKRKNIIIHASAYDEYLRTEYSESRDNQSCIVYIDQFLEGHSDFEKSGERYPVMHADLFHKKMVRLFEKLEQKYGVPVVIAAHPKAEYKGNEYGDRKIVWGQTSRLLRNAVLVIDQTSTCLAFVALLKKPLLTIYSKEFFENTPSFKNPYEKRKELLKTEPFCIDDLDFENDIDKYIVKANCIEYDFYVNRYVLPKDGICDRFFYEIVRDKMLNSSDKNYYISG